MSIVNQPMTRIRIRAPQNDGECLILPAEFRSGPVVRDATLRNSLLADAWPTSSRAYEVRSQLDAWRAELLGIDKSLSDRVTKPRLIIGTGHQPHLYHAGVWVKNFLTDSWAKSLGAAAIHFVVDNDLCREQSIWAPSPAASEQKWRTSISFDDSYAHVPFEMRPIVSRSQFDSFGDRVTDHMGPLLGSAPIAKKLWRHTRQVPSQASIGDAVAFARRNYERELGLRIHEVSVSQLSQSLAFSGFFRSILRDAREFAEVHNLAIAEYRDVHGLRSKSHPAPDLEIDENEVELPFWIWTRDNPTRRRLFLRKTNRLTDHGAIDTPTSGETGAVAEHLGELQRDRVFIRPRALSLTLFVRLFLTDLFVHGIGGAKYDLVTDQIIRRFYGVPAPSFATATATFHIPLSETRVRWNEVASARHASREAGFHAESLLTHAANDRPEIDRWLSRKADLLRNHEPKAPGRSRKPWHDEMAKVNAKLNSFTADIRNELNQRALSIEGQWKRSQALHSREYSFCLAPEEHLVSQLRAWTHMD